MKNRILIASSCVFTIADEPEFHKNECEKLALKKIATSEEKTVLLECECTVMEWEKITDPNKSAHNTQLLVKWNIMNWEKLYYQRNH